MEEGSEPYVRLASLRQLHLVVTRLSTAHRLAETLQTVADGVVEGLGFEMAAVNLVRPEGDLVVAAVAGSDEAEMALAGRIGSRASWDRRLSMGEAWGSLRFIPYTEGWVLDDDDVPQWHPGGPAPKLREDWQPGDRLFAPLYASDSELLGVLSVDRPRNGRKPGAWGREALQLYSSQAAIALSNARLRSNVQRALVRLEREQSALRASEESFRQAFEYAPGGLAVAEMGGENHGRLLRVNDTLCRLLGRPASALRRCSLSDLVHPDDVGTLLRTAAEGGRAELRLARRDGSYVWVSLRNSVVVDTADGPRSLLTYVEDIEDRKHHELKLAHRASHDPLTGLPNSAELRARLKDSLCTESASRGSDGDGPREQREEAADGLGLDAQDYDELGISRATASGSYDRHVHLVAPEEQGGPAARGLAVLFCDLDGMKAVNDRFGHNCGDAVLVEVARRLSGMLSTGDTVARFGGDEFVVLAEGRRAADAERLAGRLRDAIVAPIVVGDATVTVDASLGLAWAVCGNTAEDVLKAADLRMYEEKRARARARRGQAVDAPAAPELRIVGGPPGRTAGDWVPDRPPVQRHFVRTWQTSRAEPPVPLPPGAVEIGSAEALSQLAGTSDVHRVVCRGDLADLSALRRLPSLRSLVITDNAALSGLDALDGCRRLRSLTVSGCGRLTDWSALARTGVVFLTVSYAPATGPRLTGLAGARRLRELRVLTDAGVGGGGEGGGREGRGSGEEFGIGIDFVTLRTSIPRLSVLVNPTGAAG